MIRILVHAVEHSVRTGDTGESLRSVKINTRRVELSVVQTLPSPRGYLRTAHTPVRVRGSAQPEGTDVMVLLPLFSTQRQFMVRDGRLGMAAIVWPRRSGALLPYSNISCMSLVFCQDILMSKRGGLGRLVS